jgi:Tfp pilus assembly protein PilO
MGSNVRRNQLILTSALGLILVMYLLAYWLPRRRQNESLRSEIQQTQNQVAREKQQVAQLAQLRSEVVQIEAFKNTLMRALPAGLDDNGFLVQVHQLADQRDLSIKNVTPQPPAPLLDLQQKTIRLEVTGGFASLTNLVYQLESMPRVVELGDFELERDKSGDLLAAKLDVKLYARSPASPPQPSEGSE